MRKGTRVDEITRRWLEKLLRLVDILILNILTLTATSNNHTRFYADFKTLVLCEIIIEQVLSTKSSWRFLLRLNVYEDEQNTEFIFKLGDQGRWCRKRRSFSQRIFNFLELISDLFLVFLFQVISLAKNEFKVINKPQ